MKQVKILYAKCKARIPKRPPDEIDFGLGFRAALRWVEEEITLSAIGYKTLKEELQ